MLTSTLDSHFLFFLLLYHTGTPDDYTGEWVSASNFKPKELDSVICSSRPFPGTHEPRVPCANISTAFECTTEDYDGKCSDELPINWFYARAINGGKEGFKLGIDLGIYKQGKKAALHRLAAARTAKWLDRQTRRVTVQIVTLNPNIDVIVSLDIGFFFDLGGHTRISRASYMFRTNNMYQASSRSIMRVSLEVLYFVLAVRWSMQSVAMILIALSASEARCVHLSVRLPPLTHHPILHCTLYFVLRISQ